MLMSEYYYESHHNYDRAVIFVGSQTTGSDTACEKNFIERNTL